MKLLILIALLSTLTLANHYNPYGQLETNSNGAWTGTTYDNYNGNGSITYNLDGSVEFN